MLIEGGFAWLPPLMWRLDRAWRKLRAEVPRPRPAALGAHPRALLGHAPSRWRSRSGPAQFLELLEQLGMDDRIMFSTDYPHWDFDAPDMALPVAAAGRRCGARSCTTTPPRCTASAPPGERPPSDVARVVVGATDELLPERAASSTVAGRSIGVFNVGGEYFAIRNRCPHQGGPLCEGVQRRR